MKKFILTILSLGCLLALVFGLNACSCGSSLVKPENIQYDGTVITWNKVELAEYYNVSINGGEKQRVNSNVFSYNANGQDFEVTVGAVNAATELEESKTFRALSTITQINADIDGTLSWDAINGATGYKISVNGTVVSEEVMGTSYNGLVAGSNRVKVKPVVSGDDSYYALWSAEKSVYINATPLSLKYDGEKISWTGNSQKYEININGQKEEITGTQYYYDANSSDFAVEVKAVGNHTTTFDSKVIAKEFHYLPNVTNLVMTDGILSWDEVVGATEYKIKINNVVQNDKITEEKFENLNSGVSLDVSLLPYAGEDYFSVWSEVKTIYILESPVLNWNADLELDGEANNNLIWNAVNGAVGYTVEVTKNGQSSVQSFGAAQSSFAHAYAEEGTYTVRVKSVAENDGTYYDSKYSSVLTIERLAAPKAATNNYIRSEQSNIAAGFTVNYQAVSNATGYQLYKDGVLLQGLYTTALSITDRNVADNGISAQQEYNYYIKSMGGVKTISGKKYVTLPCLTEKALAFKITVQAMPTGLEMSGYNAQWNPVAGHNGYAVKYSGTNVTSSVESCDLSTLRAGT
ncbi:MAG: hypothetical protein IJY57_03700, partial [Clostridia bacterium]|nr:hypothetical protein [Clostridia bacterium]